MLNQNQSSPGAAEGPHEAMNKFEEWLASEEEAEAERFSAALDALATDQPLDAAPADAPDLYDDLRTVAQLREGSARLQPRQSYRMRSRALVVDSAAPLARERARHTPIISRQSFLVPFASAAAAAGLTIAAVLGATALGYGPGGTRGSTPEAVAAANQTQRSIQADLRSLQASLDAVVAAANRGEDIDARVLRSIAETNLNVTSLIEASPSELRVEDVILYYQAAAATHIKLGEIAPRVSATPALAVAQRASEDGVIAASKQIQAFQEQRALGPTP